MDELVDKDVKTANVNVLHIYEKIDESMSMLRRDVEDTKKGQTDTISETENTLDGINRRLDTTEDKISELEKNIVIENCMLVTPRFRTFTENSSFLYSSACLTSDTLDDSVGTLNLTCLKLSGLCAPSLHCFTISTLNKWQFIL